MRPRALRKVFLVTDVHYDYYRFEQVVGIATTRGMARVMAEEWMLANWSRCDPERIVYVPDESEAMIDKELAHVFIDEIELDRRRK